MKTFETEKHNIPEGATHYRNEDKDSLFTWLKVDDAIELWCDILRRWRGAGSHVNRIMSQIVPIPQTNIETPEDKAALDLIDTTPHQYESVASKEAEWVSGLPPVGVECEYAFSGGNYSDWFECEILYVGKQCVFIKTKDENLIKSFGCEELSVEICNTKFRKPETPQQREEREREELADLACENLFGESIQNCRKDVADTVRCMIEAGYKKESKQ